MKHILLGSALLASLSFSSSAAFAESERLQAQLATLLTDHKRVKAAEADVRVARESLAVAKGSWYPTLGVAGSYGHERQLKGDDTQDTQIVPRTLDFTLTQKLWDFGSTPSAIRSAVLTVRQSQASLTAARQTLLLDAITAHMGLLSAAEVLRFALESEDNIKKQAELEDARVTRGSGFSTDVLQAKAQLAGANARRVQAEGAMHIAMNRYKAVYGAMPGDLKALEPLSAPVDLIPPSLDASVKVSLDGNPLLVSTRFAESLARENIVKTKADSFAPTFNAVAQSNHSTDESGTHGSKHEDLIKVEMSYSINLGLTALNTLKVAEETRSGLTERLGDAEDQIEEAARNAWHQLKTAKENAEFLRNQANITSEFLEDARKERALGRRSLIDVLTSETALINASSDAVQAELAVVIAAYTLVGTMGRLEQDAVR